MLILTLHKKFLCEIMFSSTNDSHQPKDVRKSPNGNAQEFFKIQYVLPALAFCDEASIQFIFISGQMIIPEICINRAKTVNEKEGQVKKSKVINFMAVHTMV